jgi:hypothetical protein
MDLDEAELTYFGQQVGLAALSFGVTQADVAIVGSALQALFGYRCSPPVAITSTPQLQSICIAPDCPLDPKAACGDYPYWGKGKEPQVAPQCKAPPPKEPWVDWKGDEKKDYSDQESDMGGY